MRTRDIAEVAKCENKRDEKDLHVMSRPSGM
jgi:hypothetical protein